jgi:tight adherence protein C
MNPLIAILLGTGIGAGVWITIAALWPWKPTLAAELAELDTTASAPPLGPALGTGAFAQRTGFPNAQTRTDLACLGRTEAWFWRTMARNAGVAAAAGAALGLALSMLAIAGPVFALLLALAAVVVAIPVTLIDLQQQAKNERAEYQRTLAVLLDQVAISLSSGAGIDTALAEALDAGAGPQFAAIRAALAKAHLVRQTPWEAIGDLGERIGIADYRQLAASISLAGTEGARIRAALGARAAAMRTKRTARAEAAADQATERMTVPVVASAVVTVLFIVIPASLQMLGQT